MSDRIIKLSRYSIDSSKVSAVFSKTNGTCFYCGCQLPPDTCFLDDGGKIVSSQRNWHIDHMVPLSKGGTYDIENLVPSCRKCNLDKGAS
jgi:5-methylcytosine-specific restriction endonuclease McrA